MPSSLSIQRHFANLKDPRISRRKRHRLIDIIVIAICAVTCGAEDWQEVEIFGKGRQDWLKRFLRLANGIPSHDTFERVFDRLDPRAFHACFQCWVETVAETLGVRQIAIDGKTLCGSADESRGWGPLHLVSAWATAQELTLGQVAVAAGSNEIPAIPKLLELLDLHGALVTIDAIGCQKQIVQRIIEAGGDYLVVVKGNQEALLETIQEQMAEVFDARVPPSAYDEHETREVGHGRQEHRIYTTRPAPEALRSGWPGLKVIGMCYHARTISGETSEEVRYFIGSKQASAKYYGRALRHHWKIENCLHWQLDVSFGEDRNRVAKRNAAENLALLRRLALALLKRHPDKKSIKCKRLAAALDTEFLQQVLRGHAGSAKV